MMKRHPLMLYISRLLLPALLLLCLFSWADPALAADPGPVTSVHKAGVCALRGQCGKKSFFGGQLPCPNNGPAAEPSSDTRAKLVEICGDSWKEGPVCCEDDQLDSLSSNLKRAEALVASCPACKANFFNIFCTLTCSPDQSLFLNVTATQKASSGKDIATRLDYFVSPTYGKGFYDSCKDVKFSGNNGFAMDLIGGGAKDYPAFLKFLGDEKPFGSPFQIDFPAGDKLKPPMKQMNDSPKRCNDSDVAYRCSCVDCPAVCPTLQEVWEGKECKVGVVPCLSFAVILVYSVTLLVLLGGYTATMTYKKVKKRNSERARLLQDSAPSDDEDEGDVVGAGMLDRPYREYFLNSYLDELFSWLGYTCASYPAVTVSFSIIIVGLLSLGWLNFSIETDPVRLWVSPTSEAALEKQFFDKNFDPFYRSQQAFLVNDTTEAGPSPVLDYDVLAWWFDVENRIRRMKSLQYGVTLDDVCFKPTDSGCVVQSVAGYFGNNFWNVKEGSWQKDLRSCAAHPVQTQCLPDFGQPLNKNMLLGGWEETGDVVDAAAMIVTWVLGNHPEGSEKLERSMDWERSLKSTLVAVQGEARERGLRLSFSTEISLEEELNKSTNTDAKIVVISYIAMFIYASLALGSTSLTISHFMSQSSKILVESKFTLGIFGIIIVLMSVSASVGLFSAMGVKVTLIIAEVIPFLVLAVGVDNIFLIVHEFERVNYSHPDLMVEERIARAMGRIGPSILLSATCETIAFGLGAIVSMPAVRNFAIYAAGAVFVNALLQVTMFVAVLSLNQRRVESSRMDCFPCFKVPSAYETNGSTNVGAGLMSSVSRDNIRNAPGFAIEEEGILQKFIRKEYAPALLQEHTKMGVIVLFLGMFTAGLALLPKVELGLDQRIAIPSDSYLISYFDDLYDYFGVGPPVYFVTKDYNATSRAEQQALCSRFSTCDTFSLANVLEQERKRPEKSFIAEPAASWIDDYFLWLNPSLDNCCKVRKSNPSELCGEYESDSKCKVCFEDRKPAWNITLSGMPEGKEFLDYLEIWLGAPTGEACPLAGKAAYSHAIVPDHSRTTVKASHFRTSHVPLRSQKDFIDAYAAARRISESLSQKSGLEVFPYSKFYIFFDQYSSIVRLTQGLLLAALMSIFVVSSTLLGSVRTGLVVSATVLMIVVDILGVMAVWGVSLNAVSLVNLVICVGIGVEFCAHIARAFMFPSRVLVDRGRGSRGVDARALSALVNVGGSVFSGITVTKLIGVCVLAFTHSKIFEIYYFRIWLALVIIAATHALVFLPVALTFAGGSDGYVLDDGCGGLEEDLRSRAYRSGIGVGEDEYDDSSDDD